MTAKKPPARPAPAPRRPAAAQRPAAPRAAPRSAPKAAAKASPTQARRPAEPLSDAELEQLQGLLDALPQPLEPLDVSMLDGYLVGVLLQPKPVPFEAWSPYVLDTEGRAAPARVDTSALFKLVQRRHRELNLAIVDRQWFDPWVFELDEEAGPSDTVFPWVAGFALATELFPALMQQDASQLLEPLATLFMHLDPDDLEDAEELLEEIETLEPPEDLDTAVESLVASSMLLADVTRPQKAAPAANAARGPGRAGPGAPGAGRRPAGPRRPR